MFLLFFVVVQLLFLHCGVCAGSNDAVGPLVNIENVLFAQKRLRGRVHNLKKLLKEQM